MVADQGLSTKHADGALTDTFSVHGKVYRMHAIGGLVLKSDQRTETRVSGSGSMVIIDGNGGGTSNITSKISVIGDVWVRDQDGVERHLRIDGDVPIRENQIFYAINVVGTSTKGSPFDCSVRYYNLTMDEAWMVHGFGHHLGAQWGVTVGNWILGAILFLMLGSTSSKVLFAIGLLPITALVIARLRGTPSGRIVIANRKHLLAEFQDRAQKLCDRIRNEGEKPVAAA